MANYENFYGGMQSTLSKGEGNFTGYQVNASQISFPTDATSSNQLKKTSDKISTGSKNIEVSGLNLFAATPMKGLAAIPKQHWKEIDRLRKLTGVNLTFHGPLVEPTGVSRGNWSEDQRVEVEKQMKEAITLAQKMDPKGNMVVTFHSSNGLPEVRRRIKNKDGSIKTVQLGVVNERTGELGPINLPGKDYLSGGEEVDLDKWLKERNKEIWTKQLNEIGFENNRARREVLQAYSSINALQDKEGINIDNALNLYKLSRSDPQQYQQALSGIANRDKNKYEKIDRGFVDGLNDAGVFVDQAYIGFKNAFNEAFEKADKSGNDNIKTELANFQKELMPVYNKYSKDKSRITEFQDKMSKGLRILSSLGDKGFLPQTYKPLEEFAIDKASESFANTALYGFKKFGSNAPIISIENPPAGSSGLTRGDELRDLVKATRNKFVTKAVETGMSKSQAKSQAEKLIGVTWDTGHINSIRKFGYDEADVVKEAKAVAPFVKHVHAVDNLGFEDSELPPGMGNVPFDKILSLHPNFKKAKKVIETGEWFSTQGGLGIKRPPIAESLSGFGSPIYSDGSGPTWTDAVSNYGASFGDLGPINPQIHHSTYGAGFTNLPAYLGGEIAGQGNSTFSGAPLE